MVAILSWKKKTLLQLLAIMPPNKACCGAESLPNTACSGLAPTAPQTTKVNQGASRSRKPLGGANNKQPRNVTGLF